MKTVTYSPVVEVGRKSNSKIYVSFAFFLCSACRVVVITSTNPTPEKDYCKRFQAQMKILVWNNFKLITVINCSFVAR
jgi:hypothetical protein